MPRVIVDYTNNLIEYDAFQPRDLLTKINRSILDTGIFQDKEIKSIAQGHDIYAVSTEPRGRSFLSVTLRMLEGRSAEAKSQICDVIMAVLQENVSNGGWMDTEVMVEICEMSAENYKKAFVRSSRAFVSPRSV
ncbi:MAG: 5-carboxymethyl-2-hydroxymuconate Delta-isomerase, partial [Saezia sp.]